MKKIVKKNLKKRYKKK